MTTQEILNKLPAKMHIESVLCSLMMYKCTSPVDGTDLYYAGYRKIIKPYKKVLSWGASNRVGFYESKLEDSVALLYQEMIDLNLIK